VNQDARVTVPFLLVAARTAITGERHPVRRRAVNLLLGRPCPRQRHGDFNPGFTFNSNGSAILAGSYVCDVDDPDMWLGVTLEQEFPATGARDMGTAIVRVTCDGVEHAFSTTITGAVQRTAFPATRRASASGCEEAMAFADFSDGVVGRTTFTAVD
jgi:hypothetical protein